MTSAPNPDLAGLVERLSSFERETLEMSPWTADGWLMRNSALVRRRVEAGNKLVDLGLMTAREIGSDEAQYTAHRYSATPEALAALRALQTGGSRG